MTLSGPKNQLILLRIASSKTRFIVFHHVLITIAIQDLYSHNDLMIISNMHGVKCRSKTASLIKSQLQGQSCHIQHVGFSYLLFLLSQQVQVLANTTNLAEHF